MQDMLMDRVETPSAWRRKDLEQDGSWCLRITPAQEAELTAAADEVLAKGLKAPDFTIDDFRLPELSKVLTHLSDDLEKGRGVVLIRGLPFDRLD